MPALVDGFDRPISNPKAGQQLIVSVNVTNNDVKDWPSVIVVMVQDSEGITQLLTWHSQVISAGSTIGAGMSWTPDHAGLYKVKTLTVSSLNLPTIFSEPPVTEVNVGSA
jgi:hypothetical protein